MTSRLQWALRRTIGAQLSCTAQCEILKALVRLPVVMLEGEGGRLNVDEDAVKARYWSTTLILMAPHPYSFIPYGSHHFTIPHPLRELELLLALGPEPA